MHERPKVTKGSSYGQYIFWGVVLYTFIYFSFLGMKSFLDIGYSRLNWKAQSELVHLVKELSIKIDHIFSLSFDSL